MRDLSAHPGIVASEGSSNAPATAEAFLIEVAAARNFSSVKLNGKYVSSCNEQSCVAHWCVDNLIRQIVGTLAFCPRDNLTYYSSFAWPGW